MQAKAAKPTKSVTRWGPERRLEFIDYRLAWDGKLNRGDLMSFFGISVPQASLDISRYRELAPENLDYDASARMYVASPAFKPLYETSSPESFLTELLVEATGAQGEVESAMGWKPPVGRAPIPTRVLAPEVLFVLVRAIREQVSLRVLYQSMQRQEPALRVLSPHALGHDGFRWHVRAYCHTRQDYRDFVMARVLKVDASDEPWRSGDDDGHWHTTLELLLVPNPKLSKASQRAVELDFGMTGGEVSFSCRQALAFYVLRHLGLHEEPGPHPEAQQVVLKNRRQVQKLLQFGQST